MDFQHVSTLVEQSLLFGISLRLRCGKTQVFERRFGLAAGGRIGQIARGSRRLILGSRLRRVLTLRLGGRTLFLRGGLNLLRRRRSGGLREGQKRSEYQSQRGQRDESQPNHCHDDSKPPAQSLRIKVNGTTIANSTQPEMHSSETRDACKAPKSPKTYSVVGILLHRLDHEGLPCQAATWALHDHDGSQHEDNSGGLDWTQDFA